MDRNANAPLGVVVAAMLSGLGGRKEKDGLSPSFVSMFKYFPPL